MKKLLLIALLSVFIFACNKSDDDSDPKPSEKYTISYNFTSIGLDTLEYIKYLNKDGVEVSITDTSEFSISFERPSNNIHGKISIKGTTGSLITGYAEYSMKVTDKNESVKYIKQSETSFPQTTFTWTAEYKNIEN